MAATPSPPERLNADASERSWRGHTFRYRLARGFCELGDTVLDAACGSGYGQEILGPDVSYVGVDRDVSETPNAVEADLGEWTPAFDFDVFCGFETIEHLPDYSRYVETAKQARKWIIVSTPIIPTTELNPHHVHNFAPGELAALFVDERWGYYQGVIQPAELSEVVIFARR